MADWRENIPRPQARNRTPDPRFGSTLPAVGRIARGKLVNIPNKLDNAREFHHSFHFLVNPSEIHTSYNTDSAFDMTLEENQSDIFLNAPPPVEDGLISMSFSILLDRTYEVVSGSIPEGVLHDIAMLERVLGVPDTLRPGIGPPSPGKDQYRVTARNRFPGLIVKRPVKAYFGGSQTYNFTGYVTSLQVQMMKFTRKMTPTRAGISLSMTTWGDMPSGEGVIEPSVGGSPMGGWEVHAYNRGSSQSAPATNRSRSRGAAGGLALPM